MSRRHYIAIILISFATLLLELGLTRVLSVTLWYHFSFLVISTAMLGFGASGVVLALWSNLRERVQLDKTLAALAIGFAIASVASFIVLQLIPFDPFSSQDGLLVSALVLPLYYVVLAFPFFWSGLAIALLLTRGAAEVNQLYAGDLIGAGAGCAALPLLLPVLGGAGVVVLAAAIALLAATVLALPLTGRTGRVAFVLCAGAIVFAPFADRTVPLTVAPSKQHPLLPEPPRPAPLFSAWNSISRVDLYPIGPAPTKGWPGPGFVAVIDGGSAATGMGTLSGGVQHWLDNPDYRPPGLAYLDNTRPRVLIIGSGGGREVLEALYYHAASVTAVEMNPIISGLVSNRMNDALGGLFQQPGVQLVTAEGRSFVRRSTAQYDAIVSVQTNSNAALAAAALGLAEGYLFTREALADYIDHLSPDGVLLVTRLPSQVARLFATVREVFDARGLKDPAAHLVAVQTDNVPWGPRHGLTVMLFKKSPWTRDEVATIAQRIGTSAIASGAPDGRGFLYSPFEGASNSLYQRLLTEPNLPAVYAQQSIDVSPATDDRPFFNQQRLWSKLSLQSLTSQGTMAGTETVLVLLLVQSIVIAGVLIILPLVRFSRQGLRVPGSGAFLVYFAGLGLGFIMIEIALLQRFTLYLGEPLYAIAVVLGSLLVFTGLGAYVGQRFKRASMNGIFSVLPAVVIALALTVLLMSWVFPTTLGYSLAGRAIISMVLIAPLGCLLGMPFPAGLGLVAASAPALVPWAWGVNGFFTVIGSVLAMMLGMIVGFSSVLWLAGACYLVCLFMVYERSRAGKVGMVSMQQRANV